MARYTDIDKLIAEYDRVHVGAPGGARKLMVEAPIADVVPRAEVAREIILEIDELICCHANGDIDDKRLYILFDELKKKYTEVQK